MKRSMLLIWLLSGILIQLHSQTFNCTDGSSITINSITLTPNGLIQCDASYDVDITVVNAGVWNIFITGTTFGVSQNLSAGTTNVIFPVTTVPLPCATVSSLTLTVTGPSGQTCDLIPLPVELLDFNARPYQAGVLLEWSTASEINNQGFDIQYSRDGQQWESIGFEKGRGNSTRLQEYDFLVRSVVAGDHYFRLKQMDEDGRYEYSPVVSTLTGRIGGGLDIYPNPVEQGQSIAINGAFSELALFDSAGRQVHTIFKVVDQEDYLIDLSPGIYFLRGRLNEQSISKKLVVIR